MTLNLHNFRLKLSRLSWFTFTKFLLMFFFSLAILSLTLHSPESKAVLKKSGWVMILMMIVMKDLADAPGALQRLKDGRKLSHRWPHSLGALLPPEIMSIFRLNNALHKGCWYWISRKPAIEHARGKSFGFLKKSNYSTVLIIALLAICVEVPFAAMMAGLMETDPAKRFKIHSILFVLTAYTLTCLFGDRYLVMSSSHDVDEKELRLQIGARTSAKIPLTAIISCEYFFPDREQVAGVKFSYPENSIVVTPFDKPNLLIKLRTDNDIVISHFQLQRQNLRAIYLYVDEPALLKCALEGKEVS